MRSLACVVLAPFVGTALAQTAETPESRTTELGKVTITATRDEESYTAESSAASTRLDLSARETPQAVSIVTRAFMQDFGLTDANAVLAGVPGVNVERVETDRTYYTARGFDIANFQVDGIGVPFAFGNVEGDIDTAIYERIEVVRGANGLSSGTGYPSATVNYVRKRPGAELQALTEFTAGSWNSYRLEADVTGPLGGTVRGRAVAVKETKDSYLDRYSHDKAVFHGVLEAEVAPRSLVTLSYSLQDNEANSPLWGALPLNFSDGSQTHYDASTSTSTEWSYWDSRIQTASVELTQQLRGDWQARVAVTHIRRDEPSKLFYAYGAPDADTGLGLFSWPLRYDYANRQLMTDVYARGTFKLAERQHQLVFGASWARSDNDEISRNSEEIGLPLPDIESWDGQFPEPAFTAPITGGRFTDKYTSVYAATRLDIAEALKIVLGANASRVDSRGVSYGADQSRSDSAVSPYGGVIVDLTGQLSAYASYTSIFNPQKEQDIEFQRLEPVKGVSYELGLKGELLEKRLFTQLAVFKTRQDHLAGLVDVNPENPLISYYRPVDLTSHGAELEISGQVAPGLQMSGGYTWIRIEDEQDRNAKTYTPKRLLRLAGTYRLPAFAPLRLGASLRWQDDIYREQGDGVVARQSGYALLDLMASYEISGRLAVSARVENVTDEKYLTSLYWEQSFYGAPRNYSASVKWTF